MFLRNSIWFACARRAIRRIFVNSVKTITAERYWTLTGYRFIGRDGVSYRQYRCTEVWSLTITFVSRMFSTDNVKCSIVFSIVHLCNIWNVFLRFPTSHNAIETTRNPIVGRDTVSRTGETSSATGTTKNARDTSISLYSPRPTQYATVIYWSFSVRSVLAAHATDNIKI